MKRYLNNKQKRYSIFTMFLVVLFTSVLTSCSDEFLDAPKDNSGVNDALIFSDRNITQTFISGILANYKGQYGRPDAGGIYSIYFARAVKGNDLIQGPSWYTFDYGHENREAGFRRTNFSWSFNYENVNFANILIDGVTNSPTLTPADKKEFIAQGKFFRGLHMFELLLDFAPNFKDNKDLVRIPLYTSPASIASVQGLPPVAASVIMDQIKSDLTDAIADLPTTRIGKSYVNKAVAQAVMARVLAVTQDDWSLMSTLARASYGGNASSAVASSNWGNGFNNMADQEWLWALFQNGSDETNFFWGHAAPMMDHLTLSYRASYFDPAFVNEFTATDVRNTFRDIYGVSASTPWREFISTKYAFTFASDIPILRKSEMVLFDAEAQYHLGNASVAQDLLFALQSSRDPNAVKSTATGQALLDEILLERKKEFYGEFGPHWFDAKRYNLPITRNAVHRIPINVPANSNLFFLKIPQTEIDNNPGYAGFNNI
ncbi:RagB/SusD family nutrient uptake outer membrane protein [Tenacibaculum aiptasiae]|uniref:RagB/SusD family nutrient uptake outer membrane protein n=1 Tax=Tenacibaculum aiptasiae TaxID=426481 RepID=UPI003B5AC20D